MTSINFWLSAIVVILFYMLICKDMSGKEELRKIRIELEKMNERETK